MKITDDQSLFELPGAGSHLHSTLISCEIKSETFSRLDGQHSQESHRNMMFSCKYLAFERRGRSAADHLLHAEDPNPAEMMEQNQAKTSVSPGPYRTKSSSESITQISAVITRVSFAPDQRSSTRTSKPLQTKTKYFQCL